MRRPRCAGCASRGPTSRATSRRTPCRAARPPPARTDVRIPGPPMQARAPMPTDVASSPSARSAIRGDLLDFVAEPAWGDVEAGSAVRFRPDHWLLVEGGRIVRVQAHAPDATWTRHDHRGRLVLPGFIDTHVHSPQLDVIASYGTELLDWLERHTFPAETRYADADHARRG